MTSLASVSKFHGSFDSVRMRLHEEGADLAVYIISFSKLENSDM
jgi:hypothetical protein